MKMNQLFNKVVFSFCRYCTINTFLDVPQPPKYTPLLNSKGLMCEQRKGSLIGLMVELTCVIT